MLRKSVLMVAFAALIAGSRARAESAKEIVDAVAIKDGNCLVIDADERLALDLANERGLRIYLINGDQSRVDAMRRNIDKVGKYGQITCRKEEPRNILFPAYFFDFVVAKGLELSRERFLELYRLTRPGGAVVFVGKAEVTGFVKKADRPGSSNSTIREQNGLTILKRGIERTNKYLKPPLVRLWVTCATQERTHKNKGGGIALVKGSGGDLLDSVCMNNVPLDPYTGRICAREKKYEKSDYEVDKPPYDFFFPRYDMPPRELGTPLTQSWNRHHGRHEARDLETGDVIWTFLDDFLFTGSCSRFFYANEVVYMSTYRNLLAWDAHTGRLSWQHRNGGHSCSRMLIARSMLFQPNFCAFRIQAFVSDAKGGKSIPRGDFLRKGEGEIVPGKDNTARDWPMFHHDPCRSGVSPDTEVKPPLKLAWKFDTGGKVRSSAAVVDGTVYVGSGSHRFFALDARTGKTKWTFFTDGEIHSSPCVWGSAVYFGCDDGKLYALSKDTGQLLWAYRTATTAPLTPVYGTFALWTPGQTKRVREWVATLKSDKGMRNRYSPARSFGPLCFNDRPLPNPGVVRSSPVIANGVLYVGTGLGADGAPCFGYLYALDACTGKLLWKVGEEEISERGELAFGIANSPCVFKNQIHFSYGIHSVVDARKGTLLSRAGRAGIPEDMRNARPPTPALTRKPRIMSWSRSSRPPIQFLVRDPLCVEMSAWTRAVEPRLWWTAASCLPWIRKPDR